MPLPDRRDHQSNIEHNPTPGHATTRACAIFSGELFERIDDIVKVPNSRRRLPRDRTQTYARYFDRVKSRIMTELRGIRPEFGWDPVTQTIDVIDPEILPINHAPVFIDQKVIFGEQFGGTYGVMLQNMKYIDSDAAQEIYRVFNTKGPVEGMRAFVNLAVFNVYVGPVETRPNAAYHKVMVDVGIQGTWDNSITGNVVLKGDMERNEQAITWIEGELNEEYYGLGSKPSSTSFLKDIRRIAGCPVDLDARYRDKMRIKRGDTS